MSKIEELNKLLVEDVLIEVKDSITLLEKRVLEVKKNSKIKEELEYMKQVEQYFNEVCEDIKLNNLTHEDACDILEGLEDMRADNQEI